MDSKRGVKMVREARFLEEAIRRIDRDLGLMKALADGFLPFSPKSCYESKRQQLSYQNTNYHQLVCSAFCGHVQQICCDIYHNPGNARVLYTYSIIELDHNPSISQKTAFYVIGITMHEPAVYAIIPR
jgi:hypothetical protein